MENADGTIVMEEVQIIFRNFRGEESRYNREGDRNFGVILPDMTIAAQMAEDGWPVKFLKPRDEEDEETGPPWMPVKVKYGKSRPPRVVLVGSRGRTNLDESSVGTVDYVDIKHVDLIVRPYEWDVQGKTGISAYLKSIFIVLNEDPLELKYADLDEQ